MKRILLWLLLGIVLVAVLAREVQGPAPKSTDAPAAEFSAGRAQPVLRSVIGDIPHPTGSAEHERVRDRVISRFRDLGYTVSLQRRFACNHHFECASVQNVLATRPFDDATKKAVVLAAHYDSVAAGPGVSDDGMGVAVLLEIARAMREEKTPNPLVFLVDDAEEVGLLGAEGWAADPALVARAGAVVNVENRGTTGASYLFETSRNNRWLIATVARALPRPITTSLFISIYELLPNDTDLTVFKRLGLEGVNFAAIGNVNAYHTPNDNQANADPRLLQHHGDNALAAARALANADVGQRSAGNAVHFDVLGLFVVSWPASITIWLAIAGLILALAAASRGERRATIAGIAFVLGAVAVAGGLGFLATAAMRLPNFIAYPNAAIASMWLLGGAAAFAVAPRKVAIVGPAIVWNLLAVILALLLPGGSYLFVVPALVLAIAALLKLDEWGAIAATVVAAVLWFPFGVVLYDALGAGMLAAVAIILALVMSTVAPLFQRRVAIPLFALAVIGFITTAMRPVYTTEKPRRVSYTYFDDGTQTFWASNSKFDGAAQRVVTPWYAGPPQMWVKDAPNASLPRVEVAVLSDRAEGGKRFLTVEVRSMRGAERVALLWKTSAALERVTINGVTPPPRGARYRNYLGPEWTRVGVRGQEAHIEIVLNGTAPVELIASDTSFHVPAGMPARRLAVPSDDGDTAVTLQTKKAG